MRVFYCILLLQKSIHFNLIETAKISETVVIRQTSQLRSDVAAAGTAADSDAADVVAAGTGA